MKEVYDKIYLQDNTYNASYDYKQDVIETEFLKFPKTSKIFDVGCGKGHYIRHLKKLGFNDVLGLEFSKVCSERFLIDINHVNEDFLEYSNNINDNQYDICLCMDVLEHIDPSSIDLMINELKRIAKTAIIGIANHSDIILGEELHLIQNPATWWETELSNRYSSVVKLIETSDGRFFIFKCDK